MSSHFLSLLLLLAASVGGARPATAAKLPREAVQHWQSNRFGLFVHWGPVSLTGDEISWSRANSNTNCPNHGATPVAVYDNLYRRFDPTNFDAVEWVRIAKSAGMKYLVLTAKHADGFLLWPSREDGYNIAATPFRRDICAAVASAAHDQGMDLGWYFSPMDWRDPDCRSAHNDRFNSKMRRELRELLSLYGTIDVLWFDTDGFPTRWDPANTYSLVRQLQPGIVINNRLEMGTHEAWLAQDQLRPNEDFCTPEQRVGGYNDQNPWETCMTLGTQWSWKPEDTIKTPAEVINILARTVGSDGNLLLDVGPMPDGRIEPRQVEVLRRVGVWMGSHGEGIYGARGGPWKPTKGVASTRRGNIIYLHILKWKTDAIELPEVPREMRSVSLVNGGEAKAVRRDGKLIITVPELARDPLDTVVKIELNGSAMDLPACDISPAVRAEASNVFQQQTAEYGPQFAFDGDEETRWATDGATRQAWISADLGKPLTARGVTIREVFAGRVRKFEFQHRDGNEWKTIFSGTTLGERFQKKFEPVTARQFRLNILEANDGPTISEIELLEK
jgi:alpha-L-fucosidase